MRQLHRRRRRGPAHVGLPWHGDQCGLQEGVLLREQHGSGNLPEGPLLPRRLRRPIPVQRAGLVPRGHVGGDAVPARPHRHHRPLLGPLRRDQTVRAAHNDHADAQELCPLHVAEPRRGGRRRGRHGVSGRGRGRGHAPAVRGVQGQSERPSDTTECAGTVLGFVCSATRACAPRGPAVRAAKQTESTWRPLTLAELAGCRDRAGTLGRRRRASSPRRSPSTSLSTTSGCSSARRAKTGR